MNAPAASKAIFLVGRMEVLGTDNVVNEEELELVLAEVEVVVRVNVTLEEDCKMAKLALKFAGDDSLNWSAPESGSIPKLDDVPQF